MLLKLAALGALGYGGYKYLQKNGGLTRLTGGEPGNASTGTAQLDRSDPHLAVAGGPLGNDAALVNAGEPMPATMRAT